MRLIKACMPDEVCALEESWRVLDAASDNPLAHFDWWRASLAAFADEETVHVVAIGDGQRLSAAAPLVRKTLGGSAACSWPARPSSQSRATWRWRTSGPGDD